MSEPELTYRELARRLRLGDLPETEPSADLWQRIAGLHGLRARRARVRRGTAWSAAIAASLAVLMTLPGWLTRSPAEGEIDWQARAQALELQMHSFGAIPAAYAQDAFTSDVQAQIALVDSALQTAYDDGARKDRTMPLWKRRSELLSTLISARQHHLEISRI